MRIPDDDYEEIRNVLPISCVDLLVTNEAGEVLLVRRANEPASGEWWLPGGRVHFAELREAAARRKLVEECGLHADSLTELKTFDVILPRKSQSGLSHAITTVFAVQVSTGSIVRLDPQSAQSRWKTAAAWRSETLQPFVANCLALLDAPSSDASSKPASVAMS